MKKIDRNLIGQKFGKLLVISRGEDIFIGKTKPHRRRTWNCLCDCGNEKNVVENNLMSGNTISCGCVYLWSRHQTKNHKTNKYDLSNEYGIGYTQNGEEFYFDLEDYDKIKDYCWCIMRDGYVSCANKKLRLHRLVNGNIPENMVIDHINHNKADNRKCNLRICTVSNNNMNTTLYHNNTSGCKGVSWHSRDCIWEVHINVNKKSIYGGRYSNYEDAVKRRKELENKYFGEYSYENSLNVGDVYGDPNRYNNDKGGEYNGMECILS